MSYGRWSMSFVLEWLFGDHSQHYNPPRWVDELESQIDQAPILKLNRAIIQQAVSDRATRIDLWVGVPEIEYHWVESPEHYKHRMEREARAKKNSNKDFAALMAYAGVITMPETCPEEKLSVFYTFGEYQFCAMTIPANLISRCIRAYPYSFNYKLCATTTRPENMVYASTRERAAFASIDHYDRAGDHKLGICLEYEE